MSIQPIHNDVDHAAAIGRIEALWDAVPGTPEHDELEVLSALVSAYEDRRWSIRGVKFHLGEGGCTPRGSRTLPGHR
jgi:HTH-type transcriptional regulator/antitoxin HigA